MGMNQSNKVIQWKFLMMIIINNPGIDKNERLLENYMKPLLPAILHQIKILDNKRKVMGDKKSFFQEKAIRVEYFTERKMTFYITVYSKSSLDRRKRFTLFIPRFSETQTYPDLKESIPGKEWTIITAAPQNVAFNCMFCSTYRQ